MRRTVGDASAQKCATFDDRFAQSCLMPVFHRFTSLITRSRTISRPYRPIVHTIKSLILAVRTIWSFLASLILAFLVVTKSCETFYLSGFHIVCLQFWLVRGSSTAAWPMTVSVLARRAWARQLPSCSHHLDSLLPHRYRSSVSRLAADCVPVSRDGTETSSTLLRWTSARRAGWTHVAFGCFLYLVRDCGTLCLDCCVTLATT